MAQEVNFDGIVGPTHNYAGLSFGNLASQIHSEQPSSPRSAALQGLEKMKLVHDLGIPQAVLPPLRRPRLDVLRRLGFRGSDSGVIDQAWKANRPLLAACFSASNMWTANAATVSPSPDCEDGRVHFTPANLASSLHRSIEAGETTAILRAIFAAGDHFIVHDPLPVSHTVWDEGAANHTRLCPDYESPGLEVFVYGKVALSSSQPQPGQFPARQTREASNAVIGNHLLDPRFALLIQQHPDAIDSGVFHNDVISVGNRNVLLYHEMAFAGGSEDIQRIAQRYADHFDEPLFLIGFDNSQLPISDAVKSYLFNSQLISRPDGNMTVICPVECRENPAAKGCLERLLSDANPVDQVSFLDLRQSMNNGGGPACLRLRVVLNPTQQLAMHQGVRFTPKLYAELSDWIKLHYREKLEPSDLRDPQLLDEIDGAFSALSGILQVSPELFARQSDG